MGKNFDISKNKNKKYKKINNEIITIHNIKTYGMQL